MDGDGPPLLVFYHGGGFVIGDSKPTTTCATRSASDGGVHVLSVDYRLAPRAQGARRRSTTRMRRFCGRFEHAAELGADPARVAVGGDSAGGNLAAVVAQRARNEGARPPVAAAAALPDHQLRGETRSQTLFAEGFFLRR